MSEWGYGILIAGMVLNGIVAQLRLFRAGETIVRLTGETERQRTIIEAQERELNQWRREYGTLTNDAVWWEEEIG